MGTVFADLVKVATATTGTSDIAVGSAAAGYLTPAQAGVTNGAQVTYELVDGGNREVGHGVYSSTGPTVTRATVITSTNSGSKISLSGSATMILTVASADLNAMSSALPIGVPAANPSAGAMQMFALGAMIPLMTSNTAPSGVAAASSVYSGGGHDAWNAFSAPVNGLPGSDGWLTSASGTGWLSYDFGSAKIVRAYKMLGWIQDTSNGRCPTAWTFQGSNDNSTWTTLDTRTEWGNRVGYDGPHVYWLGTTGSYRYYRINVTANNGNSYMGIQVFQMYGAYASVSGRPTLPCMLDENGNVTTMSFESFR